MWLLAGLIWTGNGLILLAPRFPLAERLRHPIGVAGMALVAVMAWRWWSGRLPADIDLAWWIMITGVFARDFLTPRTARDARAEAGEPA